MQRSADFERERAKRINRLEKSVQPIIPRLKLSGDLHVERAVAQEVVKELPSNPEAE